VLFLFPLEASFFASLSALLGPQEVTKEKDPRRWSSLVLAEHDTILVARNSVGVARRAAGPESGAGTREREPINGSQKPNERNCRIIMASESEGTAPPGRRVPRKAARGGPRGETAPSGSAQGGASRGGKPRAPRFARGKTKGWGSPCHTRRQVPPHDFWAGRGRRLHPQYPSPIARWTNGGVRLAAAQPRAGAGARINFSGRGGGGRRKGAPGGARRPAPGPPPRGAVPATTGQQSVTVLHPPLGAPRVPWRRTRDERSATHHHDGPPPLTAAGRGLRAARPRVRLNSAVSLLE
jgi:hypothetical protein